MRECRARPEGVIKQREVTNYVYERSRLKFCSLLLITFYDYFLIITIIITVNMSRYRNDSIMFQQL